MKGLLFRSVWLLTERFEFFKTWHRSSKPYCLFTLIAQDCLIHGPEDRVVASDAGLDGAALIQLHGAHVLVRQVEGHPTDVIDRPGLHREPLNSASQVL